MRRQVGFAIPLTIVSAYYLVLIGGGWLVVSWQPWIEPYLPVGAIDNVMGSGGAPLTFDEVISSARSQALTNIGTLALGIIGGLLLVIPVSWVYMLTHEVRDIQESLVQTIMIMPVVVAGIAMIVQNSIALAFSLAGIVAAVRFRVALGNPVHATYVFVAIVIGLGAGISALEVSAVTSVLFVYASMIVWKLDYGDRLGGPVISRFTGDGDDG